MFMKKRRLKTTIYIFSTEEDAASQCLGEKITLRGGEATSPKSHKGFPQ